MFQKAWSVVDSFASIKSLNMMGNFRLLLSLLCNGVHTALSAQISATASGPNVTAIWILEPGDPPEAESSFTVQQLNFIGSVQKVRGLTTYTPNQFSTGTLEWEAEVTGYGLLFLANHL